MDKNFAVNNRGAAICMIAAMFILGFIYDKTNKPAVKDEDGKNNIKQFQTRSKHIVEFSDEKGKEKISVTTGKGASIVMDDELEKITLTVKGLSIDMDGKEKSARQRINHATSIVVFVQYL